MSNNQINLKCSLKGQYKIIVRRADLSIREETDWFDNVILNQGIDGLFLSSNAITGSSYSRIDVGTGSTPAKVTDSALESKIGECGDYQYQYHKTSTQTEKSPYSFSFELGFRSALGGVVGNISEVGFFSAQENVNRLMSRSLVVDSSGNPTSITVKNDEYLDVIWKMTVYMGTGGNKFTFNDKGTTREITCNFSPAAMAYIGNSSPPTWDDGGIYFSGVHVSGSKDLPSVTAYINPPYDMLNYNAFSEQPYESGTYKRQYNIEVPLNFGNFENGIGSFMASMNLFVIAYNFSEYLPKTKEEKLSLQFEIEVTQA